MIAASSCGTEWGRGGGSVLTCMRIRATGSSLLKGSLPVTIWYSRTPAA